MSRRLTSLPSVAPTMRPSEVTTSTTSGSGLFQFDIGCSPASMPVPTAAIGCALEKISASGPMPTSRYWLHMPCAISASLSAAASREPGRSCLKVVADDVARCPGGFLPRLRIAAGALLDHPLDHRDGEGHARRLDRLEVDGSEQPRLRGVAFSGGVLARMSVECRRAVRRTRRAGSPRGQPSRTDRAWSGSGADVEHPAGAHGYDRGPSASGRQTRPASAPAEPSAGSVCSAFNVTAAGMSAVPAPLWRCSRYQSPTT